MSKTRMYRIWGVFFLLLAGGPAFVANAGEDTSRRIGRPAQGQQVPSQSGESGPANQGGGKTLHTLIVGINRFKDSKIRELRYCRADAEAVNALLTDRRYSPFEDARVRMLLDEKATLASVKAELENLAQTVRPDDTVVVYFSSHGMQQDGNTSFWILHDSMVDMESYGMRDLRLQPKTGLEQSEINGLLNRIRARRMVVLVDCCFSAATVISFPRGEAFRSPPVKDPLAGFKGEGRVVITASKGDQLSTEAPGLGHGAFTYFLIEGLQGAADSNHDNVVELWESWQYLERKVTEAAKSQGNIQNPTISTIHLTHGFPLSTYPMAARPGYPAHAGGQAPDQNSQTGDAGAPAVNVEMGNDDSLQLKWINIAPDGHGRVAVSATEITNRQYLMFVKANGQWAKDRINPEWQDGDYLRHWPAPDRYPDGQDEYPVTYVSWFAAKAFAEWVGGRLPREVEWTTAAEGAPAGHARDTGMSQRLYPWGGQWNPNACNNRDSRIGASGNSSGTGVVNVTANEKGASVWPGCKIYNMAGNAWEWCDDWVFERKMAGGQKAIAVTPVGPDQPLALNRLIKGGSFLADRIGCMIASRTWADSRLCAEDGGFRVIR